MTVTQEQLEAFIEKYPVTEPVQPKPELGADAGSFTTEMLGDRLQAWADAHPDFTFEPCRTSKGPGFQLRCPGDLDGWPDGEIHGDKVGKHNGSAVVWVDNGHPRFRCSHSHCDEGANHGKKTWRNLQEFYDPERRLHSVKGNPTVGGSARAAQETPKPVPVAVSEPETVAAEWFFDADTFLAEKLPPRHSLVLDNNGTTLLYEKSLNQIFAYRGQGKTMFTHGLVSLMIHGGEFLRYKSEGGYRVLIADGELPDIQLQERIQRLIGNSNGLLRLMSPDRMPNHIFPSLSNPEWQAEFLKKLDSADGWRPSIIVFDTLTACFRFDTNDADLWSQVNQFLIGLRIKGYCVILVHHAGKSGTQRGRTDGDDNLDLSIKLDAPKGWGPGDGLEIKVIYEKVRAGGDLPEFQATYENKWEVVMDVQGNEIVTRLLEGDSAAAIANDLGIDRQVVYREEKKAAKNGIDFTAAHEKRKAESRAARKRRKSSVRDDDE